MRPSQYSPEPSVFTWKLIEEGRNHLVLDKKLALPCPVRLLHGQSDPDVPWEYSLQIAQHLEAPEVVTTLVKGGDHRLSTPADIARLIATVEELVGGPSVVLSEAKDLASIPAAALRAGVRSFASLGTTERGPAFRRSFAAQSRAGPRDRSDTAA